VTCPDRHITELRCRVLETILRHNLCQPHDRLIVAVSGGADSVALLDILSKMPDFPLSLVVAHLNHSLRGAESDADEQFVRNLAKQYQLPLQQPGLMYGARRKAGSNPSKKQAGKPVTVSLSNCAGSTRLRRSLLPTTLKIRPKHF